MVVDGQRVSLIRYARKMFCTPHSTRTVPYTKSSPTETGRMRATMCSNLHHCISPTARASRTWAHCPSFRASHPMQQHLQKHSTTMPRIKHPSVHDQHSGTICCMLAGPCGDWNGRQVFGVGAHTLLILSQLVHPHNVLVNHPTCSAYAY